MIGITRKNSSFIMMLIIYSILMLINCALTKSPYSAWHSGRVGVYSSSTVFAINIAYVLVLSILITFAWKGFHIYKRNIGYLLCFVIFLSGIWNGRLLMNPKTYVFDILMLFFLSNLARNDSVTNISCDQNKEFRSLGKIAAFSLIGGMLLTIFGAGKYGYLPFDFTRDSRGEVTWWVILFLPVIMCIITVIRSMEDEKNGFYLILSMISVVVVLSTSSRTYMVIFLVVAGLYVVSQRLSYKKFLLILLGAAGMILMWPRIWGFFTLGGSSSVETVLNGRLGLWAVYWDAFKSSPIVGYGTNVYIDPRIGASSEIGLLKDITHYGIFFGIITIWLLARGIRNSYGVIKNYALYNKYDLLMAFLFFVSAITMIQQHARVLQFSDYICWYSIFYVNTLNKKRMCIEVGENYEQRI